MIILGNINNPCFNIPELSEVNCIIAVFLHRPIDCYRAVVEDSAENSLVQRTASTTMKIFKEQIAVKKYLYRVQQAKQVNNDLISYTALSIHVETVCSMLSVL